MIQHRLIRTAQLRERGLTNRDIRVAVAGGALVRLRRGAFATPDVDEPCMSAGTLRGRVTCVSELARHGVFVMEAHELHVHIERQAARLPARTARVRAHRDTLRRQPHPDSLVVDPIDALVHSARCQDPRAFIAGVDSALHRGLIRPDDLDVLFASLPRRHRRLRRLVDGRAESGPESLMRLILRSLGCSFEPQVQIDGVGRVDFLVDGWLIIECDSESHHSSWEQQRKDRRRDQAAAALGYATYRPIAEDIMWHREHVIAAVSGLVGR